MRPTRVGFLGSSGREWHWNQSLYARNFFDRISPINDPPDFLSLIIKLLMEFQSKSSIDLEISLQKPFTKIRLSDFHRNCSICNNCSKLLFLFALKSKFLTFNSKEILLAISPMSLVYTFRVRMMMGTSSFNHVIVHNSYTRNASNGTS